MNIKIDTIKEIVEEFFKQMGFAIFINDVDFKDDIYFVRAQTNEARVLIGEGGDVLFKIQSVLNKIINKSIKEDVCIDLDINDYKKERMEFLQKTTREIADQVKASGISKTINNLSAYERRVVHMEIAQIPELETESVGDGEERRLIIKLKK